MAVNLVDRLGRPAARDLLEQSFAQYQANGTVVGMARQVSRNTVAIASHAAAMRCHLGDTTSYLELLNSLAAAEKEIARAGASRRRDETARDLSELRRGDVVEVPTGRRAGLAVILDPGVATDGSARPLVVTAGAWAGRLTSADFRGPVPALGRVRLGKFTDHRSAKVRRDVASALASSGIRAAGRAARLEPVEQLAKLGLVIGQRLVVQPLAGRVQRARVVLALADVQPTVDRVAPGSAVVEI